MPDYLGSDGEAPEHTVEQQANVVRSPNEGHWNGGRRNIPSSAMATKSDFHR